MAMSKVLVNFIQDRSGSMQSVWTETLNGFRTFVKDLKEKGQKDGVEYLFSLTTFDTVVDMPYKSVPLSSVDENILQSHGPRGSTALYDAVGATIQETDANRNGAEKVIVVVVTDGHENSSREWTKERLHIAVDAKLNAGDWTFTYLGTQPETWDDAAALGVGAGSVSSYTPTMASAAYQTAAHAVSSLASSHRTQSRSLMKDYVTPSMAASSGMALDPDKVTVVAKQEEPKKKEASTAGRWR
jgi:uncharacterized protein YegL